MTAQRYRKKPVVVEAMRFIGPYRKVAEWCGGSIVTEAGSTAVAGLIVHTPEGSMKAAVGDWIIKGIKGEFYPCKPDIFQETYELESP